MRTTKTIAGYDVAFRSRRLLSAVLAAALALALGAAPAHACVTVSGTLTISGTLTTECVNVTTNGKVYIAGGTLVLTGANGNNTSTINGFIQLQDSSSKLSITTNNHTLGGTGYIEGQGSSAKIAIGDALTLTNQTTIRGQLEIVPAQGASGTTFTNGTGGVVRANSAGILLVQPNAIGSGSGCWEVTGSSAAFLQIATTARVTGDVTVANANGTLDIDADVCTTGDLSFAAGKIDVASGVSFSAGGSCP
jgi:hypothetical protein